MSRDRAVPMVRHAACQATSIHRQRDATAWQCPVYATMGVDLINDAASAYSLAHTLDTLAGRQPHSSEAADDAHFR